MQNWSGYGPRSNRIGVGQGAAHFRVRLECQQGMGTAGGRRSRMGGRGGRAGAAHRRCRRAHANHPRFE